MAIVRITPRKQALLDRARRRRRQLDWKNNPDNPDMLVPTRLLHITPFGTEREEVELTPDEMSKVCADSFDYAERDPTKPNWDRDPLYSAARKLRKRRRAQQKLNTPTTE